MRLEDKYHNLQAKLLDLEQQQKQDIQRIKDYYRQLREPLVVENRKVSKAYRQKSFQDGLCKALDYFEDELAKSNVQAHVMATLTGLRGSNYCYMTAGPDKRPLPGLGDNAVLRTTLDIRASATRVRLLIHTKLNRNERAPDHTRFLYTTEGENGYTYYSYSNFLSQLHLWLQDVKKQVLQGNIPSSEVQDDIVVTLPTVKPCLSLGDK